MIIPYLSVRLQVFISRNLLALKDKISFPIPLWLYSYLVTPIHTSKSLRRKRSGELPLMTHSCLLFHMGLAWRDSRLCDTTLTVNLLSKLTPARILSRHLLRLIWEATHTLLYYLECSFMLSQPVAIIQNLSANCLATSVIQQNGFIRFTSLIWWSYELHLVFLACV